jgi:hypothetical protein
METLIGTKVLHGSPSYENEETIAKVWIEPEWPDHVTIEFESEFFTRISPAELEELKQDGEIHYKNWHHNGLEVMILK